MFQFEPEDKISGFFIDFISTSHYHKYMRHCKVCLKLKDFSEFRFYQRLTHNFYSNKCKHCLAYEKKLWVNANFEKDNERNKQYNKENADRIRGLKLAKNYWPTLTWQQALDEWDRIYFKQNKCCAICPNTTRLYVDHCHKTLTVRGLLCYNCNNGIGRLKDNVEFLQNAIDYLKKEAK